MKALKGVRRFADRLELDERRRINFADGLDA